MIEYIGIESSPRDDLLRIMNDARVRKHLLGGKSFTPDSLERWVSGKRKVDQKEGCRVNGILIDGNCAGWCGIQLEDDGTYGLGIILDSEFWGYGKQIYQDMIVWARELGHQEVYLHLLDSRTRYSGLMRKLNAECEEVQLFERTFLRYRIPLAEGKTVSP